MADRYTYIPTDPNTGQLQATPHPPPAQVQAQPPQGFDVEKFAADSATRQMMFAYTHGGRPTQQDFEDARKSAYQQGMETMRQMQLDQMRRQGELQKQQQMRMFEQFGPREMSAEEIKDTSGLLSAHNQIMMLYHQNADIPENDAYRTTAFGGPAAEAGQAMDPNIRLFEATRGGSIISLGRGLLQDTGQVAGKDEAQALIKKLMPGPGDSSQMAARKTADMIQMEMNGLQAKMQALPQNVDATPLRQAYANAYNDYSQIVNQSGSDSQKKFAPPSPQQLWGQNAPPVLATVTPPRPAVQGGFSQATTDTLNAQAAGKPPMANQPVYTDVDPRGGTVWNPPSGAPPLAAQTVSPSPGSLQAGTGAYAPPPPAQVDVGAQLRQNVYELLKPKQGPPQETTSNPPDLSSPNVWQWGQ